MRKTIRVAIVGCGDVAGGYDERKKGRGIFTHAGAYKSVPNIEISSAYDINKRRLDEFSRYWSVKRKCSSFAELLKQSYDIVSVCTSDDTHEHILKEIIRSGCTRYIWVEKPLTCSANSAAKVIRMAAARGVYLWPTSQRRWEPCHIKIRQEINKGRIGKLIHATGYYVKGITHNGSMLIDTLRFLCGEIKSVRAFSPFDSGSYGKDYSLRGWMQFKNGASASIIGCDKERYVYSIFEMDIIGTKGRIEIKENGDIINFYQAKKYDYYSGFKELKLRNSINTRMKWTMKYGLGLLLKQMFKKKYASDLAREVFKSLWVADALKLSAKEGGARIAAKYA